MIIYSWSLCLDKVDGIVQRLYSTTILMLATLVAKQETFPLWEAYLGWCDRRKLATHIKDLSGGINLRVFT